MARLTETQALALWEEERAAIRAEGLHYLRHVRTRDEADPEAPLKTLPDYPYITALWSVLEADQRIVIAKSRQMMVSWIMAIFATWWARSKDHQAIFWQTQKWDDACIAVATAEGSALGRCHFIESNLPAPLRLPVRTQSGKVEYPNGSYIQGLAGGADQIRGKVASVIIQDEFAFQPEAAGVYTAVVPLVQKKTKIILVSTPNGGPDTSEFARLFHGVSR